MGGNSDEAKIVRNKPAAASAADARTVLQEKGGKNADSDTGINIPPLRAFHAMKRGESTTSYRGRKKTDGPV